MSFFDRLRIRTKPVQTARPARTARSEQPRDDGRARPGDWIADNERADALARNGKIDDAVTHLCALGDRLAADGFLARAHGIYKKALRLQPDNAHAAQRAAEVSAERISQTGPRLTYGTDETRATDADSAAPTSDGAPAVSAIDADPAASTVDVDPALSAIDADLEASAIAAGLAESAIDADLPASAIDADPAASAVDPVPAASAVAEAPADESPMTVEDGLTGAADGPADDVCAEEEVEIPVDIMADAPVDAPVDSPAYGEIAAVTEAPPQAPEQPQASKTVPEILQDASFAAAYGDVSTAVNALMECARAHPDLIEPVAALVEIAGRNGLDDVLANAEARLCDLYYRRDDYEAARQVAEALVQRYPDDARHRARLSTVEASLEEHFEAAPQIEAPADSATEDHGPEHVEIPADTDPRAALEHAAADQQQRFAACRELARLDAEAGDWLSALAWLERASTAIPDPAAEMELAYDIALVFEGAGDHDRAVGVLSEIAAQAGSEYRDVADRIRRLSAQPAGGSREQLVAL